MLDFVQRPEPDGSLKADTGLLSPDGQLFECRYEHHDLLAETLGFTSSWNAERAGWLHLSDGYWRSPEVHTVTQKQLDVIFEWSVCGSIPGEREMPSWAKSIEIR